MLKGDPSTYKNHGDGEKIMKSLKIGLCSALALLALSGCTQEEASVTAPPEQSTQAEPSPTSPAVEEPSTTDEIVETEAGDAQTEIPVLAEKPGATTVSATLFSGEMYDIYQGQHEKFDIEPFYLDEENNAVKGGAITEWVENYMTLVLVSDNKAATFYVTEESKFNEDVHSKEQWLALLLEAEDVGFQMYPSAFELEITYSEDEFGNRYVDYADVTVSEKYEDAVSVDVSSLDYSDSSAVKIRYIFSVGEDLMTITTYEGERSDDSGDIEYRVTDDTTYSSLDASIVDGQVKDAILANGSNLSDELEMICNVYWVEGDTHNDYQNIVHIELVSFG